MEIDHRLIPEVNIGILGHVSHGKTSLTQALTGKLTLQHSEELKRGITIKLGYADLHVYRCRSCGRYGNSSKCVFCFSDSELQRTVSFVDAPGHEILMATVLTGSSIIDGALLVIAANEECPQPQTLEHLKALEIVGIKNIVIVQTKIDLVTREEAMKNYEEIKKFISGTVADGTPIIPVSSTQKINIDKVIEAIEKFIPTPKREEKTDPRFLVIRSFDVNKPGSQIDKIVGGILGGSIVEGKLRIGDKIEIKPGVKVGEKFFPLKTEIVGLKKAGFDISEAGPGGLLGMLTKLDPSLTKSDGLVGNVVGLENSLPPLVNEISFQFFSIERAVKFKEAKVFDMPFKIGEKVLLHYENQRTIGVVKEVKKERLVCSLSIPLVLGKKEKRLVVSRQIAGRWRLAGYGIL
ncbi:MAG: translation initiation factor IF-2 subunit gamma [Candidatus Aenigmarchaeota archaeon]|nr:translation initiation factor IF-2 subunit gamma [Candidatus Aenigmarchaeota archaeon]